MSHLQTECTTEARYGQSLQQRCDDLRIDAQCRRFARGRGFLGVAQVPVSTAADIAEDELVAVGKGHMLEGERLAQCRDIARTVVLLLLLKVLRVYR